MAARPAGAATALAPELPVADAAALDAAREAEEAAAAPEEVAVAKPLAMDSLEEPVCVAEAEARAADREDETVPVAVIETDEEVP